MKHLLELKLESNNKLLEIIALTHITRQFWSSSKIRSDLTFDMSSGIPIHLKHSEWSNYNQEICCF